MSTTTMYRTMGCCANERALGHRSAEGAAARLAEILKGHDLRDSERATLRKQLGTWLEDQDRGRLQLHTNGGHHLIAEPMPLGD